MNDFSPRRPAGTPSGGQFAPSQHSEGDIELVNTDLMALVDKVNAAAEATDVDVLDRHAADPDETVRCQVASNPAATHAQLERLARDREWSVRWELARRPTNGDAVRHLIDDPDPRVRLALCEGPHLTSEERERILATPEVQAIRRFIEAAEFELDS